MIGALGKGASGAAQGMAQNRGTQASLTLNSNKQFEDELLQRMAFNQQAQSHNLRDSVFSSMLANYHPAARPDGVSTAFAGAGQPGQDALNLTAQDALAKLQHGDALALPANQQMFDARTVPDKFGKASIWEKILGIVGAGASAYAGFAGGRGNGSGGDGV
jgi:hypothetical protein